MADNNDFLDERLGYANRFEQSGNRDAEPMRESEILARKRLGIDPGESKAEMLMRTLSSFGRDAAYATPGVGAALHGLDAKNAYDDGRYGPASISALLAALGLVPPFMPKTASGAAPSSTQPIPRKEQIRQFIAATKWPVRTGIVAGGTMAGDNYINRGLHGSSLLDDAMAAIKAPRIGTPLTYDEEFKGVAPGAVRGGTRYSGGADEGMIPKSPVSYPDDAQLMTSGATRLFGANHPYRWTE